MIHFVGAGPGAEDLITLRGAKLLEEADCIIYAGSLVNPKHLLRAREGCAIYNSATMTLEEVLAVMEEQEAMHHTTVRLHTGDPSMYGAIREQMDALDEKGIGYDVTPGVSSVFGAAATLNAEFTLPGISQTLILTRMAGRTPVPEKEALEKLAAHGSSMAIFLSAGLLKEVEEALCKGAFTKDSPAAIVYKATWPEEKTVYCTVGTLAETAEREGIKATALIFVGDFLTETPERSKLYDPTFATGFRTAKGDPES